MFVLYAKDIMMRYNKIGLYALMGVLFVQFSAFCVTQQRINPKDISKEKQKHNVSFLENESSSSTLILKGVDFISDESLTILAKSTRNVEEINLKDSVINDQKLLNALPALAANNPGLKSLDLTNTFISANTLKKVLEAFPLLEKLKLDYLTGVTEQQQREILLPWIKNNPNLKYLKNYVVRTVAQLEELTHALPATLEGLELGVYPSPITSEIMDKAFPKFASKCGATMKYLNLSGSWLWDDINGDKYAITLKNYKDLPKQLPYLTHVVCYGGFDITSEEIRNVYQQWKKTQVLDFTWDLFYINGTDAAFLIDYFPGLKEIIFDYYSPKLTTADLPVITHSIASSQAQTLESLVLPGTTPFEKNGLDPSLTNLEPLYSKLKYLNLNWIDINNEDMKYLGTVLGGPNLKELDVDITPWVADPKPPAIKGNVFPPVLKQIAKRSPNLEKLGLHGKLFLSDFDSATDFLESTLPLHALRKVDLACLSFFWPGDLVYPLYQLILNNPNLFFIELPPLWDPNDLELLKSLCPEIGRTLFYHTYNTCN